VTAFCCHRSWERKLKKHVVAAAAAVAVAGGAGSALAADLYIEAPADPVAISEPGDWYVSLFGGGAWVNEINTAWRDEPGYGYDIWLEPGFALGVTVGTKVFDMLRIEGELSGTLSQVSEIYEEYDDEYSDLPGSISALYLLGNVWFDVDTGSGFTPYIGGGVGAAAVALSLYDGNWETDGTGFAYQLGAGVQVDVADNITLDLGYRYKAVPDLTLNNSNDDWQNFALSPHVFQAGLAFNF